MPDWCYDETRALRRIGKIHGPRGAEVDRVRDRAYAIDFELAESLAQGGRAAAYLRLPNLSGELVTMNTAQFLVTVRDHMDTLFGDAGAWGKAEWKSHLGSAGEWSIYQLQCG